MDLEETQPSWIPIQSDLHHHLKQPDNSKVLGLSSEFQELGGKGNITDKQKRDKVQIIISILISHSTVDKTRNSNCHQIQLQRSSKL